MPDIVMLAIDTEVTRIVGNAIAKELGAPTVVLEKPIARWQLIRRRYAKLGLAPVVGQVLFSALAQPLLTRAARVRVEEIKRQYDFDDSPIPIAHRVASVNAPETRTLLAALQPKVIVVGGTRIISRETLACVAAPFINMHFGITPRYRGVHGGYWALAENRPDLVGTTVHLVDSGIDSGTIIEQVCFSVGSEDSFATYPLLHLAAGLPALLRAIRAALADEIPRATPLAQGSQLHYHPTVWGYLGRRALRNVR